MSDKQTAQTGTRPTPGEREPEKLTAVRVILALTSALALSGCYGDPPPDPTTAPLEIVVDGCKINRSEVSDGRHQVTVLGAGKVKVLDASGDEVLSVVSEEDGFGALETTAQTYEVECTSSDEDSSTQFESTAP